MTYLVYSDYFSRLPWTRVDWSNCPRTFVDYKGDTGFLEEDINDFVEHLIRNVSLKTHLEYSIVHEYIVEVNSAFFRAKERLFSTTKWHLNPDSPEAIALKNLLVMPDIDAPSNRVEQIKSLFDSLSDADKFQVIAHFRGYKLSVTKVTPDEKKD